MMRSIIFLIEEVVNISTIFCPMAMQICMMVKRVNEDFFYLIRYAPFAPLMRYFPNIK